MAAGKLVLLLVAGAVAGAAFAGMTTGTMRSYGGSSRDGESAARAEALRADEGASSYAAAPPARQGWLEEGVSMLDSPAWPFGHGYEESYGEAGPPAYAAPQGYEAYPPPGYGPRPHYEDEPGGVDRYAEDGHSTPAVGPSTLPAYGTGRRMQEPLEQPPAARRGDAASAAAARAADAAQDVIAAEDGL